MYNFKVKVNVMVWIMKAGICIARITHCADLNALSYAPLGHLDSIEMCVNRFKLRAILPRMTNHDYIAPLPSAWRGNHYLAVGDSNNW